MALRTTLGIALASALAFGCANSGDELPEEARGELKLNIDDRSFMGVYTVTEEEVVTFRGVELAEEMYEVTVELHGMTLDVTMDTQASAHYFDGYATDTGEDTMITEEDRVLIEGFLRAMAAMMHDNPGLEEQLLEVPVAAATLRAMFQWMDWGTTMPLSVFAANAPTRGCQLNLFNAYLFTHDCWGRDHWDSDSTAWAWVGDYGFDYTKSHTGSGWYNGDTDHHNYPTMYGDCFARCGGGCNTWWDFVLADPNIYSYACGDHDECTRGGHSTSASLPGGWCSDDFVPAIADGANGGMSCY